MLLQQQQQLKQQNFSGTYMQSQILTISTVFGYESYLRQVVQ